MNYFKFTWKDSTKKAYAIHLKRWALWAFKNHISVLNPTIANVLRFLRKYFETGVGYGAVNTARCALSMILPRYEGKTVGEHFLIRWFCKSCYIQRPPQPRYSDIWSVDRVLIWVEGLGANSKMSRKMLSLKLTILLLLVSSQRGQTILNLQVDRMLCKQTSITFRMKVLLKHNQLGQPLDAVTLFAYPKNKKLCVVRTITRYLERTKDIRKGNTQLLLSYIAPFAPISRATLARWTLVALNLAGIDTNKYKAHSTRGASASAARAMGANINAIMKNASWKDAKSFAVFYNKTINDPARVQRKVLDRANRPGK